MKNKGLKWHTEQRRIDDLIPFEGNPRQMTQKQKDDLQKSLEKFNLVEIPAIDTDNRIIAGHQRLKIMQLLGRGEEMIDVRMPNKKLTDEEFREYNLRSNKNLGEWDYDLLANIGEELLLDVGFESEELDKIFQLGEDEDIDEVPELPEKPKTKLGDLYQLGEHRLMCGDATKKEDVEKLMGGEEADMVFTDPPYGIDLDTDYSQMPKTKSKYRKIKGDEKEFNLLPIFQNVESEIWYIFGADYLYRSIPLFDEGSLIVWAKRQSEKELSVFGSAFELVWTYPKKKKTIWFERAINQSGERLGVHPTQKPVALSTRAIKNSSKRGCIVLDLFGGSGSTLIACEQLNRKCCMMEIDPKYIDVIIARWEKFTGKQAVKLTVK